MNQDTIAIIDMGSTENSTLARMIWGMGVYSEIQPHDITGEQLKALTKLRGIILNGGENRIVNGQAVMPSAAVMNIGLPILAIGCDDLPAAHQAGIREEAVRDHARSFEFPVIIRAVHTVDAMTATIAHPEWAVLDKITRRIVHEVKGVNRVCYDLTPKPTGTIEWE